MTHCDNIKVPQSPLIFHCMTTPLPLHYSLTQQPLSFLAIS